MPASTVRRTEGISFTFPLRNLVSTQRSSYYFLWPCAIQSDRKCFPIDLNECLCCIKIFLLCLGYWSIPHSAPVCRKKVLPTKWHFMLILKMVYTLENSIRWHMVIWCVYQFSDCKVWVEPGAKCIGSRGKTFVFKSSGWCSGSFNEVNNFTLQWN